MPSNSSWPNSSDAAFGCDLTRQTLLRSRAKAILQTVGVDGTPQGAGEECHPRALSILKHYFEGMRCAWMHCKACSKVSASRPAAFITEEVGLAAATQRLRMEMAQAMNIQFEKNEVVSCPRCEQQMRAPCEAAALRCANCRAVINPKDCKNRNTATSIIAPSLLPCFVYNFLEVLL